MPIADALKFVAMLYAFSSLRPGTCHPKGAIPPSSRYRRRRTRQNTWVLAAAMAATWPAQAEVRPHPVQSLPVEGARWESPAAVTVAGHTPQGYATGASIMAGGAERGSAPAHAPDGRVPSTIPTPIDNPWALGLLGVLVVAMLWLDQRQRLDTV